MHLHKHRRKITHNTNILIITREYDVTSDNFSRLLLPLKKNENMT